VIFKQANLDQRIQYDAYPRKSLLDLFYDNDATLEAVAAGQAAQRGDFAEAAYEARIRRNPDRIQVQLIREGSACGMPVKITKGLTLDAGRATLEIAYLLERLPQDRPLHFAVEFNFAGLPAAADDRYFHDLDGNRLGQLGTKLDLHDALGLGLCDEWLGIDVGLKTSRPTHFWTFPVETVSQSEGGFELVHQSTAVQPHWFVTPDHDGRWMVSIEIALDTSRAESRLEPAAAATIA
jgi:alpha-amylase